MIRALFVQYRNALALAAFAATSAAVIVALYVIALSGAPQPKRKTAYVEARTLQQAITVYLVDEDRCPSSLDELLAARYVSRAPIDPWGRPYRFRCDATDEASSPAVWSAGADGVDRTADDVQSWSRAWNETTVVQIEVGNGKHR